jgi:hypothetical protein
MVLQVMVILGISLNIEYSIGNFFAKNIAHLISYEILRCWLSEFAAHPLREGDRQWTPCVGCYGVGPIGRHPELFPFFRFGAPGSSYSPATALIKSNIYAISESLLVQPRLRWESCCPQEFRRRVLWVMGT